MQEIGAYKPDTARDVLEVIDYLKRNGYVLPRSQKQAYNPPPNTPVYFRNDTGETIPPFACLQASGTVEVGGQNYIRAVKPTDVTGEAGMFFFNMFREVPPAEADRYGVGDVSGVIRAKSETMSVANGDSMRPKVNTFLLEKCPGPFHVIGPDDLEDDCIRIAHSPRGREKAKWILCQLDEEGALTDPAVLSYWDGGNPEQCDQIILSDPLGIPCPLKNEKVLACHRPEIDDYAIVSSVSALLGTPQVMSIASGNMDFDGCGLTINKQNLYTFPECESESEEVQLTPDLIEVDVVLQAYEGAYGIYFEPGTIKVCDYNRGTPFEIAVCKDVVEQRVVTDTYEDYRGIHIEYATVYVCTTVGGGASLIPYDNCELVDPACEDAECVYRWQKGDWDDHVNGEWIKTQACPTETGCQCTGPPLGNDYPADADDLERRFQCSGGS